MNTFARADSLPRPRASRRVVSLALAVLAACALATCSQAGQPKASIYKMEDAGKYHPAIGTYGGMLRLTTISDPKSFNPITAKETSTTEITGWIFEGLTRTNGISGEIEPWLAKSWDVSKDGLTYTFHLREDVVWNDGAPFTAEDVEFTYKDVVANPDVPTSARDILMVNDKYPEVKALDKHTVQFKLGGKFAPFDRIMGMEIVPKHKLQPKLDAGPKSFNEAWDVATDPAEIVGTGPFILEKYEASQRVLLKRNPNYWRKDAAGNRLPYINQILYVVVKDLNVALLRFQENQVDILGLRGTDFPVLARGQSADSYWIYKLGPTFSTSFLALNMNEGTNPVTGKPYVDPMKLSWFTNLDLRHAIMHAMDRQSMVDIVLNGFGYIEDGVETPKTGFFYNPNVVKYDYNPAKAKRILATAGFKDTNGDGFVEDAAGNTVQFTIITNAGNDQRQKMSEMISKDLNTVGIKAGYTLMEFNTLVEKLDVGYDWEGILLGLTGGPEPHFGANVWRSAGQLHMWYPLQKKPATAWEARIDEIFDQAVQELDKDQRKRLYDEWQALAAENVPFMYTVVPETLTAVRNKFGNLAPSYLGDVLHNADELYILNAEPPR